MNIIKVLLGASALLFSSVLNATLIEYSISGTAFYYPVGESIWQCPTGSDLTDRGCDDILTGSMYVSDIFQSEYAYQGYYDVISFAINIGDYGYGGGSGRVKTGKPGQGLRLDGSGGLIYGPSLATDGDQEPYKVMPLPESWSYFNFQNNDFTTTSDGLYQTLITVLTITKVASVPEPSIAILLASGLLLMGFTRRKV